MINFSRAFKEFSMSRSTFFLFLIFILNISFYQNIYSASVNDWFDPNANDDVYSIVVQPDQKILVGGVFTQIGGQARNLLARINPDGTLDSTFTTNVIGNEVDSIILQPDGKILIVG